MPWFLLVGSVVIVDKEREAMVAIKGFDFLFHTKQQNHNIKSSAHTTPVPTRNCYEYSRP